MYKQERRKNYFIHSYASIHESRLMPHVLLNYNTLIIYVFFIISNLNKMWNIEWEHKFLFNFNIFNEAECLVCNQKIKKISAYSLRRHYNINHSEFHSLTGVERTKCIIKLRNDLNVKNKRILYKSKNNTIVSNSQLKASYIVALGLAKKGRPFEDGQFFKDLCLSILPLFGEAGEKVESAMNEIPLSAKTITRRTEDIGNFIKNETKKKNM